MNIGCRLWGYHDAGDDDDDDDDDFDYLIQYITYQKQLHPSYNT